MSKFKRNLLIILLIINSITLTGCWNYREINEMGIVTSLAIDKNTKNNKYSISVEIIQVQHGEKGGTVSSKIYYNDGDTIFEAARDLIDIIGRKLYWSHNKVIIISKNIAESDITPALDWLFRDQELRFDTDILVSKAPSAKEILLLAPSLENIVGLNLSATIKNQRSTNRFPRAVLGDVVGKLSKEEKSILIPLIEKQFEVSNNALIMGSAILKREKVIGYLSGEDTFNSLWVQDKVKTGTFVVKGLGKSNTNATIEIFSSKTKTKFINRELIVNVKADVDIAELTDGIPFQKAEDQKKVKEEIEKSIENRLTSTIKKVQSENKADIFGFDDKVKIQDKKYYKKVALNWGEEFATIPVKVKADVYIRGSAMISKQIKGGE